MKFVKHNGVIVGVEQEHPDETEIIMDLFSRTDDRDKSEPLEDFVLNTIFTFFKDKAWKKFEEDIGKIKEVCKTCEVRQAI